MTEITIVAYRPSDRAGTREEYQHREYTPGPRTRLVGHLSKTFDGRVLASDAASRSIGIYRDVDAAERALIAADRA